MTALVGKTDAVYNASYNPVIAHVIATILKPTTVLDDSYALHVYMLARKVDCRDTSGSVMQAIWRESHRLLFANDKIKRSASLYKVRMPVWKLFLHIVSFSLRASTYGSYQREVALLVFTTSVLPRKSCGMLWRYLRLPSDQSVLPSRFRSIWMDAGSGALYCITVSIESRKTITS